MMHVVHQIQRRFGERSAVIIATIVLLTLGLLGLGLAVLWMAAS